MNIRLLKRKYTIENDTRRSRRKGTEKKQLKLNLSWYGLALLFVHSVVSWHFVYEYIAITFRWWFLHLLFLPFISTKWIFIFLLLPIVVVVFFNSLRVLGAHLIRSMTGLNEESIFSRLYFVIAIRKLIIIIIIQLAFSQK